jgi:hypothetical protein
MAVWVESAEKIASSDHWAATVQPIWDSKGLCPEFTAAVDAHIALHGTYEVWNHFGGQLDGGESYPSWYDSRAQRCRPLKMAWVADVEPFRPSREEIEASWAGYRKMMS